MKRRVALLPMNPTPAPRAPGNAFPGVPAGWGIDGRSVAPPTPSRGWAAWVIPGVSATFGAGQAAVTGSHDPIPGR